MEILIEIYFLFVNFITLLKTIISNLSWPGNLFVVVGYILLLIGLPSMRDPIGQKLKTLIYVCLLGLVERSKMLEKKELKTSDSPTFKLLEKKLVKLSA